MSSNRSQFFYEKVTGTADFEDNDFELQSSQQTMKIKCDSGTVEFSLNGNDVDGEVQAGEELDFDNLNVGRIAIRGAGAECRVWAWK